MLDADAGSAGGGSGNMSEERIFLSVDEAMDLLPEGDSIHTFFNTAFGLIGADWSREDIYAKMMSVDHREITGNQARSMKHGLALWNNNCRQSDILFVETNMDKVNTLYPEEEESK